MDGFDWIADDSALDVLIEELIATEAYALDTEFHRERTYYPTLALVQIGTPQRLALVDPLAVDVGPLRRVFASDALCVMHAGSQDLEILEDACGQVPAHIFDTQLAALFAGYRTTSLGNLVTDLLGVTLDKSSQLTDWTQRPLPDADQRYAAADVAHLLALKDVLTERLEETGRLGWAEEEIERLRAKDRSAPDPATLWWKLRGKSKLTGRARGVAQELAAWRNERGRDANRPPRTVLSDMAVLALAQRPAKSEGDLRRVRNLDLPRFKHTEELLAAIRRGVGLARDDLRLPPRKPDGLPAVDAIVALCVAWLSQRARDEGIDPSMLGTRDDVAALVLGQPSRLTEGWRHQLVGKQLQAITDGSSTLRVDGTDLALEPRLTQGGERE